MATQTGYKASELGMIPQDWEISTIKDVILGTMQNGLFYEPSRKKGGTLFINVGDMYLSSPIKTDLLATFQANEQEIKKFRVYNGDLLFTRSSIVPEGIAFCNFYASEQIALFDSHLIKIRANRNLVLPDFLYLNCISNFARKFFVSNAKTAIMTTIDQKVIGNCPVLLPSIFEQTAIATALSDTDALISSLQTLIAKKKAIKLSAMQNLLSGKIRLPEFAQRTDGSPKTTRQTELGCVPEDWEVVELGKRFETFSGGTPSTSIKGYYGGDIKWITSSDLNKGIIYDVENTITELGFQNSSAKKVKKDTLLLALYGATAGVVGITKIDATINQAVLAIIPKRDSSLFLYYWLSFNKNKIIETYAQGGQANLSGDIVRAFNIVIPKSITEQSAIAQLLSDMDAEIEALECRLKKTQALKQGMMQTLLTGKIRLPLE
ncbi:restriction endonuclease subunit S [Neisseria mucosa]|nr:restriction endonuclease subunit S [Neisseria mucosa]